MGSRARIVHLPPPVLLLGKAISYLVKDVVITPDENAGLTANLLVSKNPPTERTLFSPWLDRHAIGRINKLPSNGVGKTVLTLRKIKLNA
ncbi:MAG: hypothetical protein AB1652_08860 [Bacillota bacterium]